MDLIRGGAVQVKGPFPKFDYSPNVKKEIGMIAGGTGAFVCTCTLDKGSVYSGLRPVPHTPSLR